MLIAKLFLVVSISVATANAIVVLKLQSASAAPQVECGGKICKNGATCKTGNICDCPRGTRGDECEMVVECVKLKETCDKINTECIYDLFIKKATCKCNDEMKQFNGSSCVDCECGEFVTRCMWNTFGKHCFCKNGYADKLGMCSPCSCGDPEFVEKCFYYKEEKNCMCNKGYKNKVGICTECNCGANSTNCLFAEETGEKLCYCTDGNSDKLGTCTHCDCSPDTSCIFTSTGEKKCVCIGKHCEKPPTPWFQNPVVIVCIVAIVGVVAFVGGFVAYRKLRRN